MRRRKKRKKWRKSRRPPPLTLSQILAWADDFHQRTGRWPKQVSGEVFGAHDETWSGVNAALRVGVRGLAGGSSLARLLSQERGVRNKSDLPRLTHRQILAWADAHRRRTGQWPRVHPGGPVADAPGETWSAIDTALREGQRGLSGGSSLARLLTTHRGVRNVVDPPPLCIEQILGWADAHHQGTGKWPKDYSGPVSGAPSETWMAVDMALRYGRRGLAGGSSLARLLARRRGVRNHTALPRLTPEKILAWADAHHRRSATWPTVCSGPVADAPGENWRAINSALEQGLRGLAGGSSLARLLSQERGVRNKSDLPRLTHRQILAWADAHYRRTGTWPMRGLGPITDAPGETWTAVDSALVNGRRGLPAGSTLVRFLREHGRIIKTY